MLVTLLCIYNVETKNSENTVAVHFFFGEKPSKLVEKE
jgi:hypothetical protein